MTHLKTDGSKTDTHDRTKTSGILSEGGGLRVNISNRCMFLLLLIDILSFDNMNVIIDHSKQQKELKYTAEELNRLLAVIEQDILPKTREGVQNGNKVFGAAILNSGLEVVHCDTNDETTCPLFHGEMKTIYEWSKKTQAQCRGPEAQESVFLSTHEPCCMCISSIVWSGFRKVVYLFPYSITSEQGIPHDINTMHELWGVSSYRKKNKYCATACLMDLIQQIDTTNDAALEAKKSSLMEMITRLINEYNTLSEKYHSEKKDNEKNSLVLD